jgi:hemerythrin
MQLIEWRREFEVGVPSVDHDHQQIIAMINELYAEIRDRDDAATVEEYLGDILVGISAHFADEERAMRQARYAEFDAHKNDHEALLDDIRLLMDTVNDNPREGLKLLRAKLSEWFAHHFRTFDARLHHRL